MNFVNPPMRAANGRAMVSGNYEFNEEGLLVPLSTEVKILRTRAEPTEFERLQLPLELPVD